MHTQISIRKISFLSMIIALAFISACFIRIPVIPAAPFLRFDIKEAIILVGGILYGSYAAFIVSLLVGLLQMALLSEYGFIGFVMTLLSTVSFVCPVSIIYNMKNNIKWLVIGLIIGCLTMSCSMMLWNYIVTPLYMKVSRPVILSMLLSVFLPFNLIKGGVNALIVLVYIKPVMLIAERYGYNFNINNINAEASFINEEGILHYKAGELEKAVSSWKKAAELNNASAMFELGIMSLVDSEGMGKDLEKAKKYFKSAAKAGHKNAVTQLKRLEKFGAYLEPNTFLADLDLGKQYKASYNINLPIIQFGNYEWFVLKDDGERLLCLSKYIIDIRPYNEKQTGTTWETCSLRHWLNEEFFNSFSLKNQDMILRVNVINASNSIYNINGGRNTEDKFFLLSVDEVLQYLGGNVLNGDTTENLLLKSQNNEYLRANLNMTPQSLLNAKKCYRHDYYKINSLSLGWWLRTPGCSSDRAVRVNCCGAIRLHGRTVNSYIDGVRPACCLNKGDLK